MIRITMACITFLCGASSAREFNFEGNTFQVVELGRRHVICASAIIVNLQDISGLSEIDCESLAKDVDSEASFFERCRIDADAPLCRAQRFSILFESKEENYQRPVFLYPVERIWSVTQTLSSADQVRLKNFAAQEFGLDANEVEVDLYFAPDSESALTVTPKETSLISQVTKILPLEKGSLEPMRFAHKKLRVNNRFLACDLKNGDLNISSTFVRRVSHDDGIDDRMREEIWRFYSNARQLLRPNPFLQRPNLVQAALVGHDLGDLIISGRLGHPSITAKRLLGDLFTLTHGQLELVHFDSPKDLENKLYPKQMYTKDITIKWSVL